MLSRKREEEKQKLSVFRSLFKSRTFSGASSHCALLVSHSVISLPNIFFRLTSLYFYECGFCLDHHESRRKIAFYSFWSRAAVWLHSLQSKKFSSLSLFSLSLSLSLSLSIIYTYIYEKKLKKSSSKPVVVV